MFNRNVAVFSKINEGGSGSPKSARGSRRRGAGTFLAGLLVGAAAVSLWTSFGKPLDGAPEALPARQPAPRPAGGAPPSALCPDGVPDVQEALTSHASLLYDNLGLSFEAWEEQEWGLPEVLATAAALVPLYNDTVALMRIADGKLEFWGREDDCTVYCNVVLENLRDVLRVGLESGRLRPPPNVTFVVNVNDYARCPGEEGVDRCTAPVLSVITQTGDRDVLIPAFAPPFESHSVPWAAKRPLAFFRGTPYCFDHIPHLVGGAPVPCSRYTVTDLTASRPDLLNATLTFDNRGEEPEDGWKEGPWTPIVDHARYQMVLNLDGFAASRRLAALLATNSVVLKQESRFSEHYYRSLRPCVHYLPIYRDSDTDVLDVAEAVLADPGTAQAVAANAHAFALMHLTEDARLRYWEALLWRYAELAGRPRGGSIQKATGKGQDAAVARLD